MSDAGDRAVWTSIVEDLVFNPDAAIPQLWRAQKLAGIYLGAPITGELPRDDGGVEQAFASGAVIAWMADAGAWIE